ncbi:MAG TPA: YraN family protein [Thermomicrobiaceae bacterium]|nr:YraN family protein [Thermomicrobiaceae bacterium]
MTARGRLGDAGERLTERRLSERGWQILDRKWRAAGGEIDLVALDGSVLVFVEVKTRRGNARGAAEEAVGPAKAARLLRLGEEYLAAHPDLADRLWRVDLVAITLDRAGAVERVSHIESAVESG